MNSKCLLRALLLFTLLTTAATITHAQGKVEIIGGDRYDWGSVAPGDLKATIVVRNTGAGVLTISRVQPACGCTSSPIDRSVLQPGETGSISVTLAARGTGVITRSMTLYSDAPGDSAHTILLTANLQAPAPVHSSNLAPASAENPVSGATPAATVAPRRRK